MELTRILSIGAPISNSKIHTHGKHMASCVSATIALPVTHSHSFLRSPERNGLCSSLSSTSFGFFGRHGNMDDFMMTSRIFPGREGRTAARGAAVVASSICCSLPRSGCPAFRGLGLAQRKDGGRSFGVRLIAPEKKRERAIVASAGVEGAVNVVVENAPLMELSGGQTQLFHRLPSGLRMEVISQKGSGPDGGRTESSRAPLLFVHGSYHGAWCWACFWMPYFSARGHDCYAISLLGQGASDLPAGKVSFSLQSHAGDIAHFIKHSLTEPPVLIGHSFGGLIVQWFFSPTSTDGQEEPFPSIAAAALVCSAPPAGNGPMVKRFFKRDLFAALQITLSLAAKMFGSSLSLCRKSFFSADMPDADVQRYQQVLKQSSRCPIIDLRTVNEFLPLPRRPTQAPPVLVLGAENDFIVDQEGTQETAAWYGTEPVVIKASAHDLMLDTGWKKAAEALESWLDGLSL